MAADHPLKHVHEPIDRVGAGILESTLKPQTLIRRQLLFELSSFFGQIKMPLPAVVDPLLLFDEPFTDQLAQDPGETLLGDL